MLTLRDLLPTLTNEPITVTLGEPAYTVRMVRPEPDIIQIWPCYPSGIHARGLGMACKEGNERALTRMVEALVSRAQSLATWQGDYVI